jgi:hypothetical protein
MALYGLDFGTTTTVFADGSTGNPTIQSIGKPESWMHSRVKRETSISVGDADGQRSVKKYLFSKTRPKDKYKSYEQDVELLFEEVISRTKGKFDLTAPNSVMLGCPAIWDGEARATLLRLAKKAGLGVYQETLVEEAVAAGISAIDANRTIGLNGKDILVYDLGGGTLDVAVLRRDSASDTLQVLASYGNEFAGDSIDEALLEILSNRAGVNYLPIGKRDEKLNEINAALTRIEKAKIVLSDPKAKQSEVQVELYSQPLVKVTLTRADLAVACAEVIRISELEVDRALVLSNMWELVKDREKTEVLVSHLLEEQRRTRLETGKALFDVEIRQDWLNDPEHNYRWAKEISDARTVNYGKIGTVVLAGGSSQLTEVVEMLKRLFPAAEFFRGPVTMEKAGQTEKDSSMNSIGLGLASQNQFEGLQFDRPALNIDLVWDGGRTRLVEAYEQLWAPGEVNPRYPIDSKGKHEIESHSRLASTNTTWWEANRISDAAPVVRKLRIPLQDSDTPSPEPGVMSVPSHGGAKLEFTRPSGKAVTTKWVDPTLKGSLTVQLGMQTMRCVYYFWGKLVFFDGQGTRKSWYINDFGLLSPDEVKIAVRHENLKKFLSTCDRSDIVDRVENLNFKSVQQIREYLDSFSAYRNRA